MCPSLPSRTSQMTLLVNSSTSGLGMNSRMVGATQLVFGDNGVQQPPQAVNMGSVAHIADVRPELSTTHAYIWMYSYSQRLIFFAVQRMLYVFLYIFGARSFYRSCSKHLDSAYKNLLTERLRQSIVKERYICASRYFSSVLRSKWNISCKFPRAV